MVKFKKSILVGISLISAILLLVSVLCYYIDGVLPQNLQAVENSELNLRNIPFVSVKTVGNTQTAAANSGNSYTREISLFGVVPIKNVRVEVIPRRIVTVCGTPFGIKLFSDGVMVVGFADIKSGSGYKNPAKTAGLKMGDVIITINGDKTSINEDVGKYIAASDGNPVKVVFRREGEQKEAFLTAAKEKDTGIYKSGMWVRDSSAGIGTMTFADNKNKLYAGLGHSINDVDTGKTIDVLEGEITAVEIKGANKGKIGVAGELIGTFLDGPAAGAISINTRSGVYGKLSGIRLGADMEVATPAEVLSGAATIRCTLNEGPPIDYTIKIERVMLNTEDANKNMVIKVTDSRLLGITGGIVQGMSGSPIIQNNRLVGAVTHVLVNDPTKGFGIFAEEMLKNIDSIS